MSPLHTPKASRRAVVSRLHTEFGDVLEHMVQTTPGAVAAVLCDEQGDAIDYAHDAAEISDIDVQLLGAQVGQTILVLEASYHRHRLRRASSLVESEQEGLLVCVVGGHYVLAMLLEHRSNVGVAFAAFDRARDALGALL